MFFSLLFEDKISIDNTAHVLLDLVAIEVEDVEAAIQDLEIEYRNPKLLHYLLLFAKTDAKLVSEDTLGEASALFELPSKSLIKLLFTFINFIRDNYHYSHFDELAGGSGVWAHILTGYSHEIKRALVVTTSDSIVETPFGVRRSIAEYVDRNLNLFPNESTSIVFLSWPSPKCESDLIYLLESVVQLKKNVCILMLTQGWVDPSLSQAFADKFIQLKYHCIDLPYRSFSQADGLWYAPKNRESHFIALTPPHLSDMARDLTKLAQRIKAEDPLFFNVNNAQSALPLKLKESAMFPAKARMSANTSTPIFKAENGRPVYAGLEGSQLFFKSSIHSKPTQPYGLYVDHLCTPTDDVSLECVKANEAMMKICGETETEASHTHRQ